MSTLTAATRSPETVIRYFSRRCQSFSLGFDRPHKILDGIDFLFFEIRFSALLAHPRWNRIKHQVATFAVNMKRRCGPLHLALAMNAFHRSTLILKSSDMCAISIAYFCSSGGFYCVVQ
jgi:hypothetical protein